MKEPSSVLPEYELHKRYGVEERPPGERAAAKDKQWRRETAERKAAWSAGRAFAKRSTT